MGFAWTIVVLVVLLAISWRFLGSYMAAVFEGRVSWLSLVERPIYRVAESTRSPSRLEALQRLGDHLLRLRAAIQLRDLPAPGRAAVQPAAPAGRGPGTRVEHRGVVRDQHELAGLLGETTMSYLSQMGSLAVQNFVSAAVGIAVAVALIRGFARKGSKTIGNFWVDLIRTHALHPAADRVRRRGRLHGAGRSRRPWAARCTSTTRSTARTRASRAGPSPRRRSSSSWGRTAAGSSTQRRQPVREPHRPDQLPVDPADPVHPGQRSPTPSARWSAASARASACSP